MRTPAGLFHQQVLDLGLVGLRNRARIAEVALLFRRLFGQDVTVISVFALDLTCAGESKTLLCSGISFHFWHCRKSNLVKHSVQRYELFRRFFARHRFFTARRRSGLSAAIAIAGCGCPISRAIRCVARVEECAAETCYKGVFRSLRPANTPAIDPHVGILSGSSSG